MTPVTHVDLKRRQVHVVEFVTALDYDLVASSGKSRDAVRTIELDDGLVPVSPAQRKLQSEERLAAADYAGATTCSLVRPEGS